MTIATSCSATGAAWSGWYRRRRASVWYVVVDRPLDAKLADYGWRPAHLIRHQQEVFQTELADILAGDGCDFVTVEHRRVGK
jgi:hypothetical protein